MFQATICTNGTCVEATVELHQAILPQNQTENVNPVLTSKDASWILTSAVIIFTMQTGKTDWSLAEQQNTLFDHLILPKINVVTNTINGWMKKHCELRKWC